MGVSIFAFWFWELNEIEYDTLGMDRLSFKSLVVKYVGWMQHRNQHNMW